MNGTCHVCYPPIGSVLSAGRLCVQVAATSISSFLVVEQVNNFLTKKKVLLSLDEVLDLFARKIYTTSASKAISNRTFSRTFMVLVVVDRAHERDGDASRIDHPGADLGRQLSAPRNFIFNPESRLTAHL
jgi:hypothetical protein